MTRTLDPALAMLDLQFVGEVWPEAGLGERFQYLDAL
jgi:hypothetical protein